MQPVAEKPTAAGDSPCGECLCCGHPRHVLYEIDRFERTFTILGCANCGFQSQANPPEDPDEYYNQSYYEGSADFSYRDERERTRFDRYVHNARLSNIARFVRPPADLLDVGCAFGGLVAAAADFGFRARGLDVSAFAVQQGRAAGLDLLRGDLQSVDLPAASVDVITMIEVIEHLADPHAVFAALARLIRPGGLAVIQTANFLGRQAVGAGADYHYYLPGHLHYYSTRTLRSFLKAHGFAKVRFFRPVDFGLLPKLLKSRGDFRRPWDYLRWLRIAGYHLRGRIAWGDFALTSSMTAYAFRDES